MINRIRQTLSTLGPGLLYAGAAVGVSHLVQSTKAGAKYQFLLIALIPLIHLIKYPFYEFGPRYTAATGRNILHGYNALGKWAIWTYIIMTLATMCIIQAAVTIVTAGLAATLFGISVDPKILSIILLAGTVGMLIVGHYSLLDKVMKFIIVFLTLTTIIAVSTVLISHPGGLHSGTPTFDIATAGDALFLAAFLGWMPAPMDISVWHSVWSEEHNQGKAGAETLKKSRLDFNVGFIGTACLAMCFLSLGALVMFGSGEQPAASAGAFAGQLIEMYTSALGGWAKYVIGAAALTTMFSTTLTCLDAYPRTLEECWSIVKGEKKEDHDRNSQKIYILVLGATFIGTSSIYLFFMQNMKQMITIATVMAFISAPIIAGINYLVIKGSSMPEELKPGKLLRTWALVGFLALTGFSIWYLATAKDSIIKTFFPPKAEQTVQVK